MNDYVLTTSRAAKVCRVSNQMVVRWVDEGLLKGFKIPGGLHRRIPVSALTKFITEHGMPAEWLKDIPAAPESPAIDQTSSSGTPLTGMCKRGPRK